MKIKGVKKKKTKKKDFLDVMYETEQKFKKLITDIYKIYNSGWVQKNEIRYLIEDIKDIKQNLITAEVIKHGRQWHFKELKENLWK
jgi:stress response protein SCP2